MAVDTPLMLQKEIAVLRPRVVLLLERGQARDAVRNMLLKNYGLEYGERYGLSDRPLERDTFRLAEREVEPFCVNHPLTPNRTVVRRSLEGLHASLHQHPLRAYETS